MSTIGPIRWRHVGEVLICGFLLDAGIYAGSYLLTKLAKMLGIIEDQETVERNRRRKTNDGDGDDDETVRVMFFPEEKQPCHQHYETFNTYLDKKSTSCPQGLECQFSHDAPQLDCLFRSLYAAKKTLDLCVYMISSYELCCAIISIHERGINVRVITDGNYCDDTKSKIGHFRAKGIPVRSNEPGFLMHHKFLIIDNHLLINGSFNWTWQAITGNNENLMMTRNPSLVKYYGQEFESLWNKFDPYLRNLPNGST